ncbi:hypothetical protein GCM10007362_17550 [Saccharibacillus endophyticus]|uniref:Uncharacterized protein n=1 Tax=Saccharibacillus endophyticus TaxID=2060666 RepID=A0ABQ1ZTC4_9BACL|nr:hypothetical protein GCM10007362_17550 [Saccharibacillus endophyticus]
MESNIEKNGALWGSVAGIAYQVLKACLRQAAHVSPIRGIEDAQDIGSARIQTLILRPFQLTE